MVFLLLPDRDHKSDINFLCIIQNEDIRLQVIRIKKMEITSMS